MSAGLGTFRPQQRQHGKPNTSRLRLTSQMDCNGLINPLFVRLYCILWQFVWRPCCFLRWFAFPREDPHWKILPAALTAVVPFRMWSGTWAASRNKKAVGVFFPLSVERPPAFYGLPFHGRFLRYGFFFSFLFYLEATNGFFFIIPKIRILIYTFANCVCISFSF